VLRRFSRTITVLNNLKTLGLHLCLALPLAMAHTGAEAAEVFRRFDTVVIKGEIKKGDSDAFASLLKDATTKYRKVVVTSAGGNVEEAMKLGQQIREVRLPLEVWGYCVSSCANFLFLSAPRRSVRDDAIVAFHAGTEGWLRQAIPLISAHKSSNEQEAALFGEQFAKMQSEHQRLTALQIEAFSAAGVSPSMREAVLRLTSPRNVTISITEAPRELHVSINSPSRCDYWVPDRAAMAEVGIDVAHYVRPSRESAASVLKVDKSRLYMGLLSAASEEPASGQCERE
jgi:ATP-dependent protease ClpP protease subunit